MSYASAMSRLSAIESRLTTLQIASISMPRGQFGTKLASAIDRFGNGPVRLNEPQDGSGASVQLPNQLNSDTPAGAARVRAAALGSSTGITPTAAASTYAAAASATVGTTSTASDNLSPALSATFDRLAAKYGVPAALAKGVARAESGFRANAVSGAGAQGLMQLMPSTARGLGVTNPFNPEQNAEGGIKYLKGLLDRFHGDTKLAVAAYNAGPNAVARFGGVPPYAETQTYVQRVLGYARGYAPDSDSTTTGSADAGAATESSSTGTTTVTT